MPERSQKISDYTEISNNDPRHTRPTDKQMGLGSHNMLSGNAKNKNSNKNS